MPERDVLAILGPPGKYNCHSVEDKLQDTGQGNVRLVRDIAAEIEKSGRVTVLEWVGNDGVILLVMVNKHVGRKFAYRTSDEDFSFIRKLVRLFGRF
ncbi:MAG: hypothetical protein L0215_26380 [Gemmataceae bacterium]|nr:hypothetical protein [Gemmataceae bacterium]